MTGAIRIWAAAFIAALTITRADAADLTPTPEPLPPAPPIFYVHVGALGAFYTPPDAQSTGGGFLKAIPVLGTTARLDNVSIRPSYTVGLEAGYFITPNWAVALSAGVPPPIVIKATGFHVDGFNTNPLGTNLVGSGRVGPLMALLQYHLTQFGALQPYFGAGAAYVVLFANTSDGILSNFSIDSTFSFVVQGGFDYMLTQNWGVFVDLKRLIYLNPNFQGDLLNTDIHIKTLGKIDPWVASAGITFKY
ncbi:MAG TPA: OmpW family outer membrane protein [Methylocella sp.]